MNDNDVTGQKFLTFEGQEALKLVGWSLDHPEGWPPLWIGAKGHHHQDRDGVPVVMVEAGLMQPAADPDDLDESVDTDGNRWEYVD